MRYHIDGSGSPAADVEAALAGQGLSPAAPDWKPSGRDEAGTWVLLEGSLLALAQVEEALRAGWHAVLRWPPGVGIRHAERLVGLAEEAGTQIGLLRPLRRLPELQALLRGDRASILTVAVDLPAGIADRVDDVIGDLVDLGMAAFGEAGLQRTEVESARGSGGALTAVAATIRHQNGALAQMVVSFGADPPRFHLVAAGGGSARRAVALSPVPLPPGGARLAADTLAFVHAVARGAVAPVPLADGLEALRITERVCGGLR